MGVGRDYVTGAVNGGETEAYLKFCHLLDKRINQDLAKGVIALWHDESQINRYILFPAGQADLYLPEIKVPLFRCGYIQEGST